ncbi:hypothetical protein AUJ14_02375 [Candidatus Micrarchaeota archaeon CG1_02_55_22]|nr:MAG: hypothetical protein AUJ14_02375 [Candidatus Micrarchaeota archaeon CG1_02_55_22]
MNTADGPRPFLLDSMILLAPLLEGDPLQPTANKLLEEIRKGKITAVCSVVSLQEVAYVLKREHRTPEQIRESVRLLRTIPNLGWLALTPKSADRAFEWMPRYGTALSDSLLAATVEEAGLAGIVTADDDFKRLPDITIFSPQQALGSRKP